MAIGHIVFNLFSKCQCPYVKKSIQLIYKICCKRETQTQTLTSKTGCIGQSSIGPSIRNFFGIKAVFFLCCPCLSSILPRLGVCVCVYDLFEKPFVLLVPRFIVTESNDRQFDFCSILNANRFFFLYMRRSLTSFVNRWSDD